MIRTGDAFMKTKHTRCESSFLHENRTLPITRKVTGKTAKLYLRVAELCEKDAANFDALANFARPFQERCEQCGSSDPRWKNEVEKWEREAEVMREKAATYRRLAGK